jgi:DNA (cytosine-5)-methyltransferase 1
MAIQQSNDGALRELALFAGAGGGILGGKLLGWQTICAVERDAYAAQVLAQRQNDGILEAFPIWSDVTTFDGKPWKGIVDVISGGFPCQDISSAGKGAGIEGERSGLWGEMARIICEVEPWLIELENSPMLTSRGLCRVLGDLAEMGFNARWGVLGASRFGANHERDRIWIVATNSNCAQFKRGSIPGRIYEKYSNIGNVGWWKNSPEFHRMDDGVAFGLDRLKAIGNGQVPIVAATAFNILSP